MYCISVNHKNSDAFIREKYALNELKKKEFYDKVRKNKNISGCICLMTCNRNEIYFEGNKAAVSEIENIYKEIKNIDYIKTLAKENNEKKITEAKKTMLITVRKSFGEKVCVNQVGSLMSVFFTDKKVVDYDTALSSDTEKYAEYFRYMLESGINLAPSQFEAMFVSAAHTQKDLEATAKVIENFK
ncbi:hypothetical protein DWW96_01855 [Eubacterium sp. AF17-7]|mgnify:FL=1|jgi:hypothetical protein|uniref:hypothetical protein n=1 Tax=Eubacterium sp. AF17-7 TaxID=2293105 RepID=UPI000E4F72E8|nr:hypothetical protein [Eubacterium sp. AF17-7]RGG67426.1 hypothetical protein DWW96_01855 [Eubacterium sp. AF17-7]